MFKYLHCRGTDHYIYNCKTCGSLDVTQRYNFAKSTALRLNYLKNGHSVAYCISSRCHTCKGPHHTLLTKKQNQPINTFVESLSTSKIIALNTSSSMYINSLDKMVLLATALVQLLDKY